MQLPFETCNPLVILPYLQFHVLEFVVKLAEGLLLARTVLVHCAGQKERVSLSLVSPQLHPAHLLLALTDGHCRVELHLADNELAVAELADFAFGFLAVGVYTSSRIHALFVEAVCAVAVSAEATEKHLRVRLENKIAAAHTSARPRLLPARTIQKEDGVCVTVVKLTFRDSHHPLLAGEALQRRVHLR